MIEVPDDLDGGLVQRTADLGQDRRRALAIKFIPTPYIVIALVCTLAYAMGRLGLWMTVEPLDGFSGPTSASAPPGLA